MKDRREFLQLISAGALAAGLPGNPLSAAEGLPRVPYGAVYFRKSNPSREDWERDYRQAAADGMNIFRHWFMWSAIQVAPGKYDWDDYDRQLELAARHGIRTIAGEILATAPQWAFKDYPHARITDADGSKRASHYTVASAVGGWPGLCLDNEDVREHAGEFLRTLAERYREHPGMAGFDVWNELNHFGDAGGCYCEASKEKFRAWLHDKYGEIGALNKAWYRYSYRNWDDVEPPARTDPYPDSIDWALFRVDNAVRLMKWRVATLREADPNHPVTAHAIPTGLLDRVGPGSYPVFQTGAAVDIYGFSGGGPHDESSKLRSKHWINMDIVRSASRGKPFWCAEMPGGASWRWRTGRKIDEGRIVNPSDIRLYTLTHYAGGTRGVLSPRWRPLQDGRFAGSFAFYAMDGSPTDRSAAAGEMARWSNSPEAAGAMEAKPVADDIALIVAPESQIFCYASEHSTDFYYRSIRGAYQAFLFNNIQPGFVPAGEIGPEHKILYLPYPVMLTLDTAARLKEWVAAGGRLISEGCPAYHGDLGRAGTTQPHYGLDELFGAREQYVQFTPDLLDDLTIQMNGGYDAAAGLFLQTYTPTTGKPSGKLPDGRIAAIDNSFGKGRTRLIGSFPGYGYLRKPDDDNRLRFFADALEWAGHEQQVASSDHRIVARLQASPGSKDAYLWIVNSAREKIETTLTLAKRWGPYTTCDAVWGDSPKLSGVRTLAAAVPAREAIVVKLT